MAATREQIINNYKTRSAKLDRTQKFKIGKESFVYESGKLTEYDYEVPMDFTTEND